MFNVFEEKLKGVELTKTQRRIAKYFLENQNRIGSLSSLEIAGEIGVSDASIIRFSRAIGYDGFADLKQDIYESLALHVSGNVSQMGIAERYDKDLELYDREEIFSKNLEKMTDNFIRSLRRNSQESYYKVAEMIISSNKRLVMGLRGCRGIAQHFGRVLSFMMGNVMVVNINDPDNYINLLDLNREDILVYFSFARYYKAEEEYLQVAAENNAKIVIISDNLMSPLLKYADQSLMVETGSLSYFNSSLGATAVAEYLLTIISSEFDGLNRIDNLDSHTNGMIITDI